jgi:broad specificity phosphatase PhoE
VAESLRRSLRSACGVLWRRDGVNMPAIFLIRHAQASYGSVDYDVLSDLGRQQAGWLDASLAARGLEPTVVVRGPARRHRDTAGLCERTLAAVRVTEDDRWAEYDTADVLAHSSVATGVLDGIGDRQLSSDDFQHVLDAALERWLLDGRYDSSNSWHRYSGRVTSALADLAAVLKTGQTALVFTSAGAIAAACCAVLNLPAASFIALNRVQVNTGITKIVHGRRGTSLVTFNEHAHLEEADRFLVTSR